MLQREAEEYSSFSYKIYLNPNSAFHHKLKLSAFLEFTALIKSEINSSEHFA